MPPSATRKPAFHHQFGAVPIRYAQPHGKSPESMVPLRREQRGRTRSDLPTPVRRSRNGSVARRLSEECLSRRRVLRARLEMLKWREPAGFMAGKEFGHPFLLTLLWCDKRVRRRRGRNPATLILILKPLKATPAGVGPPTEFIFFVLTKKTEPKESSPQLFSSATQKPALHSDFGAAHIRYAQPRRKPPETAIPFR